MDLGGRTACCACLCDRRRAGGRARHGLRTACRRNRPCSKFTGIILGPISRGWSSLYTTGRSRFAISYPNDPTALALPFDNGRSIRGEEVSSSTWQSYPVPSLDRTLRFSPAVLRCFGPSRCCTLGGPIRLEGEGDKRQVVNGGELELRDAILIDLAGPDERREHWLGTIAAGAAVDIDGAARREHCPRRVETGPGPDANPVPGRIACNLGAPRTKTRVSSGWLPGSPGTPAGKSSSRPSIGTGGSPRSWFICAAVARPVPTAGATTGSPPVNRCCETLAIRAVGECYRGQRCGARVDN